MHGRLGMGETGVGGLNLAEKSAYSVLCIQQDTNFPTLSDAPQKALPCFSTGITLC